MSDDIECKIGFKIGHKCLSSSSKKHLSSTFLSVLSIRYYKNITNAVYQNVWHEVHCACPLLRKKMTDDFECIMAFSKLGINGFLSALVSKPIFHRPKKPRRQLKLVKNFGKDKQNGKHSQTKSSNSVV